MFRLILPRGELDLPTTVTSGQSFRWRKDRESRWVGIDGDSWYRVEILDHGSEIELAVESNSQLDAFQRLFRLEESWDGAAARMVAAEPTLAGPLAQWRGLRPLRLSCPTETLFSFICSANNHLPRITAMVEKLAGFGEPISSLEPYKMFRFPSAAALAKIDAKTLRNLGFGYRSEAIVESARLIESGALDFGKLGSKSYTECRAELQKLPGVGPKVADCVALYGFHHGEAVPIDVHMGRALVECGYGDSAAQKVAGKAYAAAAQKFRERLGADSGWAHLILYYDAMKRGRGLQ
jgi:N-glycosylase/DNA lyase